MALNIKDDQADRLAASIVMRAKTGDDGVDDLDALLAVAGVRCIGVDETQARLARDAFARFGKRLAPAGLNFGDCFAYALARSMDRPLLYRGADFSQTDVVSAVG